ncbi:MAG: hypothetical protein ACE5Q6_21020 [Dehalococcoidia bacterium]
MGNKSPAALFTGALITSTIGALMLLIFDFGGWYYRVEYAGAELDRYGAVGLLSAYFPLVLVLAASLLYASYVSYTGLRPGNSLANRGQVNRAFWATLVVFLILVAGAVIFAVLMAAQGLEDWWLDAGFYGGAIGSALSAVLLRLGLQNLPD